MNELSRFEEGIQYRPGDRVLADQVLPALSSLESTLLVLIWRIRNLWTTDGISSYSGLELGSIETAMKALRGLGLVVEVDGVAVPGASDDDVYWTISPTGRLAGHRLWWDGASEAERIIACFQGDHRP